MSILDLLPLLVGAAGVYFLIKLRLFFLVHPIKCIKRLSLAIRDKTSRRSLALALAGTLGVGNIVGVAYGILVSGGGCIFWILISSLFSSVIKYAESSLSHDMKVSEHGGMMYVIKKTFKRLGAPLAVVYALLCVMLSLTMGTGLQAKSAVFFAEEAINIKSTFLAITFVFLVIFSIYKGTSKIEKITSYIIPFATIVYILLCFSVIFKNSNDIGMVLFEIASDAFSIKSLASGALIFSSQSVIKEGFARGLLSNEAGAGTSAMAESRSRCSDSVTVGLLGISEVFFDTTVLCTLTGITILISGVDLSLYNNATSLLLSAFLGSLGSLSAAALAALIFAFAYSTVICWYYYGAECIYFLFGKISSLIYGALFIISLSLGFFIPEKVIILITDYVLFFMTVITLIALIKKSERIAVLSENIKEL